MKRWGRGRAARIARRAAIGTALTIGGLLAFGLVVSVIGYIMVAPVAVAVAPDSSITVREVTGLYPVAMRRVVTPHTIEEIAEAVRASPGPISIGGGRYSMGGQTATPDGVQIDMRSFHGVVSLDTIRRIVTVRAGTTWHELQEAIDRHGLAVKIMQTYNTFTVGGALSVNAHGRYMGQGPLIRSVRQVALVLADGRVLTASRAQHPELFFAAVGGYGAVGVIAEVTLDLAANSRVKRTDVKMPVADYPAFLRMHVQSDTGVIFHNADIYPPAYTTLRAASYTITTDPVTEPARLQPADQHSALHQNVYALISGGGWGKTVREHVIDPMRFASNPVTWRSYEASYDVSELEPRSRHRTTYVLQEYFVPVDSLLVFVPRMAKVFQKHHVNVVNVSIRHALPDSQSFLAWAPVESFALVIYYRQDTDLEAQRAVARWTREMTDSVIGSGGRYYLPYQPHATRAQFEAAYPRARELFAVKRQVDPTNKFTNVVWDLYEPDSLGRAPAITAARMPAVLQGEARQALDTLAGYYRSESSEYLTHPEWDLVYSSEAYARWLSTGRQPSAFPYVRSVGTFWRSYAATWRQASVRSNIGLGTHVMLTVIGVSTAIEYGLKGLYENTVGWLSELAAPRAGGGTPEEQYAARVARDYAALIATRGWYEFPFAEALRGLWRDVPATGPGLLRKWERRAALSGEYGMKAAYASLISVGTKGAYTPDDLTRYIVVAGWSDSLRAVRTLSTLHRVVVLDRGYSVLAVSRYTPYRDALAALANQHDHVRVAEIDGNAVVTLTGVAPRNWLAPRRCRVVVAYADPTSPDNVRVLLSVPARDLLEILAQVQSQHHFVVDHIYDY